MAKSNGFFTLRRGSTKSLTFQVMDGKQITKDRVSSVANPRTSKQQWQRAIMATVMAAYSAMKPICDHSFQGKKVPSGSQREFMRVNLNRLRANVSYSIGEGSLTPKDTSVRLTGPKSNLLVQNEYIISNGSMAKSRVFNIGIGGDGLGSQRFILDFPDIRQLIPSSGNLTIGDVVDALGIEEGTQVTFCFASISSGIPSYTYNLDNGGSIQPSAFTYARFKFHIVDRDEVISFTQGDSEDTKQSKIWAKLFAFVRSADTAQHIVDGLTNYEDYIIDVNTHHCQLLPEPIFALDGFDEGATWGFGLITSEIDGPGRSYGEMKTLNNEYNGLSLDIAPLAWADMVTNVGDSELYLEGGK